MKSVAIVTIESTNFGNRLQNYALQETIRNLGFRVETIKRSKYDSIKSAVKAGTKGIAMSLIGTKGGKFRDFDQKIHKSRFYASADEADDGLANYYDFFVAGSDQVWNPYFDFTGKSDLLAFARPKQRISYAASFGVSNIPNEKKDIYAEFLSDFSAISVRENSGAMIVKELTGRDSQVVLDPTLMLHANQWTKLEKKPYFVPNEPYALIYALGDKSDAFSEAVNEIRTKQELKIIDIRGLNQRGKQLEAGPAEFIYLIHHAEIILTDSFHATAFSLIYNKNVMTFHRAGIDMSSRIVSLADAIGLRDNFDQNGTFCVTESTDYSAVNIKLDIEKQASLEFLKNSLTGGVLSVIIPVYNVAEYLDTCIQSVIVQIYENFELILVDDGSTDGSEKICDEWERKDTRVRVIHQKNAGVSAARNLGLKESKGDAVIFLDADDEIEPDMFAEMLFELHCGDVDGVICGFFVEDKDETRILLPDSKVLQAVDIIPRCFDTDAFIPAIWNKMFRKKVLYGENGSFIKFPEGVCNSEDFAWLVQVLMNSENIACIGKAFYHYKRRDDSAISNLKARIDERAVTEVYAIAMIKNLCREISEECYYLASKRYMGLLLGKLYVADRENNKEVQNIVLPRLQETVMDFPVRNKSDRLTQMKAKFILKLKRWNIKQKIIVFVENKLSFKKHGI